MTQTPRKPSKSKMAEVKSLNKFDGELASQRTVLSETGDRDLFSGTEALKQWSMPFLNNAEGVGVYSSLFDDLISIDLPDDTEGALNFIEALGNEHWITNSESINLLAGDPTKDCVARGFILRWKGQEIKTTWMWWVSQGVVVGGGPSFDGGTPAGSRLNLEILNRKMAHKWDDALVLKAMRYQADDDLRRLGLPNGSLFYGRKGNTFFELIDDQNTSQFDETFLASRLWHKFFPDVDASAPCELLGAVEAIEANHAANVNAHASRNWFELGYRYARFEAATIPLSGDGKTKAERANEGARTSKRRGSGGKATGEKNAEERAIKFAWAILIAQEIRAINPRISDEDLITELQTRMVVDHKKAGKLSRATLLKYVQEMKSKGLLSKRKKVRSS